MLLTGLLEVGYQLRNQAQLQIKHNFKYIIPREMKQELKHITVINFEGSKA